MSGVNYEIVQRWRCFEGEQKVVAHDSACTSTRMTFSVYLPPAAEQGPVPTVVYLSGLTCTWENATTKAGFQRIASALGIAVVCPDTSPRGPQVPDDDAADLGQGAGFYVDATQTPWASHYRMYEYVTRELLSVLSDHEPLELGRVAVMGHSMGGHGALVVGLRNPQRFVSVSAFSPVVAPSQVPWGQKAFSAYLGPDRSLWSAYDACELLSESVHPRSILVDQGAADGFLASQLQTQRFSEAAARVGQAHGVRMRRGYDHSYYYVATFIEEHLRQHAEALRAT